MLIWTTNDVAFGAGENKIKMCAIEYASAPDKQVLELRNVFRFGTKWGNLRNEMLVKLIWSTCHECIERTLKLAKVTLN